jgi:hypothetical protein
MTPAGRAVAPPVPGMQVNILILRFHPQLRTWKQKLISISFKLRNNARSQQRIDNIGGLLSEENLVRLVLVQVPPAPIHSLAFGSERLVPKLGLAPTPRQRHGLYLAPVVFQAICRCHISLALMSFPSLKLLAANHYRKKYLFIDFFIFIKGQR